MAEKQNCDHEVTEPFLEVLVQDGYLISEEQKFYNTEQTVRSLQQNSF